MAIRVHELQFMTTIKNSDLTLCRSLRDWSLTERRKYTDELRNETLQPHVKKIFEEKISAYEVDMDKNGT